MKIADPIKITKNGNLLVRSIRTKEECRNEGYQYEWEINSFSFNYDKEDTCEKLGINKEEFDTWKIKFDK